MRLLVPVDHEAHGNAMVTPSQNILNRFQLVVRPGQPTRDQFDLSCWQYFTLLRTQIEHKRDFIQYRANRILNPRQLHTELTQEGVT